MNCERKTKKAWKIQGEKKIKPWNIVLYGEWCGSVKIVSTTIAWEFCSFQEIVPFVNLRVFQSRFFFRGWIFLVLTIYSWWALMSVSLTAAQSQKSGDQWPTITLHSKRHKHTPEIDSSFRFSYSQNLYHGKQTNHTKQVHQMNQPIEYSEKLCVILHHLCWKYRSFSIINLHAMNICLISP